MMSPCFAGALLASLLLAGCVLPGSPYYGAIPPNCNPTELGYAYPNSSVLPYAYAPQEIIVMPSYYPGWGNGYWYANSFWPYRNNCGFWNGNYYGGYRLNQYVSCQGSRGGYQPIYGPMNRYKQVPPAPPARYWHAAPPVIHVQQSGQIPRSTPPATQSWMHGPQPIKPVAKPKPREQSGTKPPIS